MLPALIIAHTNGEAVHDRLKELRSFGIQTIFIFVDGYRFDGNLEKQKQRELLEKLLEDQTNSTEPVEIFFSDSNLGVGIAIPTAVDWFFSNVEYGLILEDDCSLLSHGMNILTQAKSLVDTTSDVIVCLSTPTRISLHKSENAFLRSSFFTSWGWITNRSTWVNVSLREVNFKEVIEAALAATALSKKEVFWLAISWADIWFSLRKNQERLWAFRFTVLTVLNRVLVAYPPVKIVQHSPRFDGTNIQRLPDWDSKIEFPIMVETEFLSLEIKDFPQLDKYICRNIQGASFTGIFKRWAYRLAKKAKLR